MSPGDEGDALASVFAWAQHHLDQDLAIDRLASARPFRCPGAWEWAKIADRPPSSRGLRIAIVAISGFPSFCSILRASTTYIGKTAAHEA